MSEISDLARELLAQSLAAWELSGRVCAQSDGAILVSCREMEIRIEAAAPGLPFRWMLCVDGRKRGAISLAAVLRQVRGALDPGYAITRVRIAALPPVEQ